METLKIREIASVKMLDIEMSEDEFDRMREMFGICFYRVAHLMKLKQ